MNRGRLSTVQFAAFGLVRVPEVLLNSILVTTGVMGGPYAYPSKFLTVFYCTTATLNFFPLLELTHPRLLGSCYYGRLDTHFPLMGGTFKCSKIEFRR